MEKKFTYSISIRVRYADTDQMGYVYYGRYAEFFEVARVEALRSVGLSYKSLEANGLMLPVYDYHVKYLSPVYYDEQIEVQSNVVLRSSSRIQFDHQLISEQKVKSLATVVLVCVDAKTMKPIVVPKEVKNAFKI